MKVNPKMTSAAWALLEQLPALEGNMYSSQADFVKWIRTVVKYCDKAKLALPFNDFWIEPINPAFSSLENTHLSAYKFPVLEHFFLMVIIDAAFCFQPLMTPSLQAVFLWIPEMQFAGLLQGNKPCCPHCKSSAKVTREGLNRYTRRVVLDDRVGELLSYRYECADCVRKSGHKQREKSHAAETSTVRGTFNCHDQVVIDLMAPSTNGFDATR
ncbi:hypothetical protein DFS34DRAFT_404352 [Phlyctochytrium arcticum]|nr:hypothetical protein DFS34DRAFT_404352 [Phlyctochytrium arcticum]